MQMRNEFERRVGAILGKYPDVVKLLPWRKFMRRGEIVVEADFLADIEIGGVQWRINFECKGSKHRIKRSPIESLQSQAESGRQDMGVLVHKSGLQDGGARLVQYEENLWDCTLSELDQALASGVFLEIVIRHIRRAIRLRGEVGGRLKDFLNLSELVESDLIRSGHGHPQARAMAYQALASWANQDVSSQVVGDRRSDVVRYFGRMSELSESKEIFGYSQMRLLGEVLSFSGLERLVTGKFKHGSLWGAAELVASLSSELQLYVLQNSRRILLGSSSRDAKSHIAYLLRYLPVELVRHIFPDTESIVRKAMHGHSFPDAAMVEHNLLYGLACSYDPIAIDYFDDLAADKERRKILRADNFEIVGNSPGAWLSSMRKKIDGEREREIWARSWSREVVGMFI